MSGICAVWRTGNQERTASTVAAVCQGLSLDPIERVSYKTADAGGVGVSARFPNQQVLQTRRLLVACDADLRNEDQLLASVEGVDVAPADTRTATLMAALYQRFGTGFPEKLQGAFSVIVWDLERRTVLAAVDHLGIKRLTYYRDQRVLLIGSRIDALVRSGEVDTTINPRTIANVLNFTVNLGPETVLTHVSRIPPGSTLQASADALRIEKYWDMRYGVGGDTNEDRLSRQLEAVVEKSVATQCEGNDFARVGAFLSGGTDSSTVVGMMARLQRGPAKAFSIGFAEQDFDELEYARLAAKTFGAEHHTYLVNAADCFAALPDMIRYFDEPFANSSAIPTYFCARLAAQHGVEVLLAGDGGDELFGGNEAYRTEKVFEIYQHVPAFLRKGLIEPTLGVLPLEAGLIGKARRYVQRSNQPTVERMLSYHFFSTHPAEEVFDPDFIRSLTGYSAHDRIGRYLAEAPATEHLDRRMYSDVKTVLGDSDLPKVTCMTELAGVQVRFPFIDRSVAEFSGHIPARLKVKGLEKRYLFKRAFRNLLPQEIIQKKKHGFGIPVAVWMKTDPAMRDLLHDTLRSARTYQRGYFRRDFVEGLFQKYQSDESTYYGDVLWCFLVLELWHRTYVDRPVAVTA